MTAIAICCFQYAFCVKMAAVDNENLHSLKSYVGSEQLKKSEDYKTKGNEEFNKGNYSAAVSLYSKAIDMSPINEILYGNRALCFLRIENYGNALGDGKRATLLKSDWPKGHYRFCTALFSMGEHQRAISANITAQSLCKQNQEGFQDLVQQKKKFTRRQQEASRDCGKPRTDRLKNETFAKK
uniref:E3 ubiquitin-protein ligase TTC3-like n=2 Tax=Callorhinchus milii TaxID=7868 RepID=A0A4W3GSK3_CALMI|eukprot:gi/632981585/ref/XP_007907673.1/ PREDICTED: E3 ubiquitin-protein ligase TTC3-like [Callorhinchus milii]